MGKVKTVRIPVGLIGFGVIVGLMIYFDSFNFIGEMYWCGSVIIVGLLMVLALVMMFITIRLEFK